MSALGGKLTFPALACDMFSLISLATLSLVPISETDPDILFSKHQALGRDVDTVEIWLKGNWKDGERASPHYVLRRTVSYQPRLGLPAKWQAQKTVLWTSDATCPQTKRLLERLTKLQSPAIRIAELPSDDDYAITVRADGAVYRVVVPGYYPGEPGKVDVTFGVNTPIAGWIDESFRAFAPCWQSERPRHAE